MREQPWKEAFVDRMGLIVALSGDERHAKMRELVLDISRLSGPLQAEVKETLRTRFTPTNGEDGCRSASEAVRAITS